jgi:hypothetical protein
MNDWFILDTQGLDGPYTLNELKTMLRDGELGASERVQQGRNGAPVAARDVAELRSAASTAPRRRVVSRSSSSGNTWLIIIAVFGGLAILSCLIIVPALLLPAVQQVREAARRSQSQDHLHHLVIAMHNYESAIGSFPAGGVFGDDGSEYHGWNTFLLPYAEQAPLYSAMNVDQTRWKDPAVAPLITTRVELFLNPSVNEDYTTFAGEAVTHYAANQHIIYENSAMRFTEIPDGLSNTMVCGEISAAYPPWAGVRNYRDLARGLGESADQFGHPGGNNRGCQIGMCDGRVANIPESTDPDTLRRLAIHDDGEVVAVP